MIRPNARHRAFTLVEMLVVIAIISILAAIIFPSFALVRANARRTSCVSNLKQIGAAVEMYKADYDGHFPFAVDPYDKYDLGSGFGNGFDALVPQLPLIQDVLLPYSSKAVFRCAGDIGFEFDERNGQKVDALPSCYEKFGTSYYYRTELAAFQISEADIPNPAQFNLMMDADGRWHKGGFLLREWRYTTLFADGHVKNINRRQFDEAWSTPAR